MALNLTPEYFEADRKYRQARTPAEKLAALEEMLRTIPKHKASEKKQADLKRKIKELKEAGQQRAAKKSGAGVDPYSLPPQGAGQALLLGLPNCGKSSIVGRLTKAPVKITDFPYGTVLPTPGMAYHEDVPIELVDLPPVAPESLLPALINAIRHTHIVLLVADLGLPSVLEDLEALIAALARHEITFDPPDEEDEGDYMRVGPKGLIVCNKCDLPGAMDTFAVLQELGPKYPEMLAVSAATGEGLAEMMHRLFIMLDVVRIYAKEPGKPADKEKPFVLPTNSTVGELARMIHKDLAENLKFARVWGSSSHSGQQVHTSHVLHDRDIVELHA
ncbi:MAG TPA: TGS domain-containing protein [Phycisphaerae bacterium]|nr:TGS domain-containing protein [Phycisphaerae bacterium]